MDIFNLISGAGDFLLFLAALGFIIFVHELGHFATAKWVGIRVEEFAIGFGPKLFTFRRRNGETEYTVRWLPLGGFVKMLGQDDLDPTKVSADPRAYNNKPIWQRMIVVSAGVVMNLIFGVIFFIVAFMIGVKFPPAISGHVQPGSPAAVAVADHDPTLVGLQPGDRIILVNGSKPSDFTAARVEVALSSGQPLDVMVERPQPDDHAPQRLRFTIAPYTEAKTDLLDIGIAPPNSIKLLGDDLPAADRQAFEAELRRFGLKPGMALAAVNGSPITEHWQYLQAIRQSGSKPVNVTFVDQSGTRTTIDVTPLTQLQSQSVGEESADVIYHLAGLVPATQIDAVAPHRPADGILQPGDIIRRVGTLHWPTLIQFQQAVRNAGDSPLALDVLRNGESVAVTITPDGGTIGVIVVYAADAPYIAQVLPDPPSSEGHSRLGGVPSPFASAGFVPGTRITKINDEPINSFADIRAELTASVGLAEVSFVQPLLGGLEGKVEVTVSPQIILQLDTLAWLDPIDRFELLRVAQKADNPVQAVALGFDKTWLFLKQTYVTLLRLVEGTIKPKHLSGPVGIAHIGTTMAERGMPYLLYFAGLISVNLAVINFLPFPIVDGGLFVMLLLEKARGRPLPLQVQSAITTAGIILLAGVFIFLTYNDFVRLFSGS